MLKKPIKAAAIAMTAAMMMNFISPAAGLLPELPLKTSAAEKFNVPKNGDGIREMTVKHVRQMATVEWKCEEDIDFSNSTDWTGGLVYKAGVQYRGVPYVSGRMDGDSDVYEFSAAIDEKGIYRGPTTWQTMLGSDCGGGPRLGFAWSGALYNVSAGNDFQYEPLEINFNKGLAPLGEYAWDKYDATKQRPNSETIMPATGEDKMYKCYTLLQEGDVVWSYFRLGDSSFGEHIRMVVTKPTVVYNDDGTINPGKSHIRFVEQRSFITNSSAGGMSTWSYSIYTFSQLFDDGYIPLTMTAYSKKTVEKPEFSTDGVNIGGKADVYTLLSGRVRCNYNIFELKATVTDKSGKTVTEATLYPYMITADLSRMKFTTPLTKLPAGKYHYTLSAVIGYGEKTLIDTDIDFTPQEETVVYISDNGTGNGSSPENALGNAAGYENITTTSFKSSALYRAVEFLSATGGTIVVCGKVTITSGHYYGQSTLSDFTIPGVPVDGQTVKLTSVYGGVDYRKDGASVTFRRTLKMMPLLELKIDTEWDNIDLVYDYDYQVSKYNIIACGNRRTVMGEGVRTRVIYDGEEIEPSEATSGLFPTICGGYRYAVDPGNTDLTILGGSWSNVAAGPCGVDMPNFGMLEGNTKLTIGGKAVIYGDVLGGSNDTHGYVTGKIDINVTGGKIFGDIILAGNGGTYGGRSEAYLIVTGKPKMMGKVLAIGPAPVNQPAAKTVVDFSEALGKAILPTLTASDFTEYKERIAAQEEPDPDEPESDSPATTDTPGGKKDGISSDTIIIAVSAAVVIVAAAAAVAVLTGKKKKST